MRKASLVGLLFVLGVTGGAWWYQSRQAHAGGGRGADAVALPAVVDAKQSEAPPAAVPVAASDRQPVAWPEIERGLIKDNAVDSDAAKAVLQSGRQQFDDAMGALETAMMGSPLARELGADYRELLLDRMRGGEGQDAGLGLDRFACSEQLCIAQFSGSDAAWEALGKAMVESGERKFPAHARSYYAYQDRATGRIDYRMLFTTNPKLNAFRGRLPRGAIIRTR